MNKRISRLHCITWDDAPCGHLRQVELLLDAGAEWIQLRQKKGDFQQKLEVATEAVRLCVDAGALLIVNDDVELCRLSGAHGVHLGLTDRPIAEAREMLGRFAIIGGTANTPAQALQRVHDGADYVGLGPWRYTGTKNNLSPLLGEPGVLAVMEALRNAGLEVPVLVIGGVVPSDVRTIVATGAHGIAVSSAVVAAPDVDRAFTEFYMALNH